jgi:hypothetical protein
MDKNFVVHERSAFTPFAVKVAPVVTLAPSAPIKSVDDFKNNRSQKKNAYAFIKKLFTVDGR